MKPATYSCAFVCIRGGSGFFTASTGRGSVIKAARVIVTKPNPAGLMPAVLLMHGLGCYSVDGADRHGGYGRVIGELEQRGLVTMRVEKTGEAVDRACANTRLAHTASVEKLGR